MQTSKVSHISNNLAWGLVIAGGIVECFWASGLKYADNLLLYTLTGMGILFSFVCMVLALKSKLEIGVVYSVFVGIGTMGIALAEIVVFNEPFSLLKITLILLLLMGVVGLKLSTSKEESANEQALAEELTEDLGLEEITQSILGKSQDIKSHKIASHLPISECQDANHSRLIASKKDKIESQRDILSLPKQESAICLKHSASGESHKDSNTDISYFTNACTDDKTQDSQNIQKESK